MRDHSIGLPFQVEELPTSEPSAWYGIAAIASFVGGWSEAACKLGTCRYAALKDVLGVSAVSVVDGGRSKILHELGVRMRLTQYTFIATVRARAPCLTSSFDARIAFQAACNCKGVNGLNDAEIITKKLVPSSDFNGYAPSLTILRLGGKDAAKRAVDCWKKQMVMPAALKLEHEWFLQQRGQGWILGRCGWRAGPTAATMGPSFLEKSVPWDRWTWKYLRMWILARLTDAVPFEILTT